MSSAVSSKIAEMPLLTSSATEDWSSAALLETYPTLQPSQCKEIEWVHQIILQHNAKLPATAHVSIHFTTATDSINAFYYTECLAKGVLANHSKFYIKRIIGSKEDLSSEVSKIIKILESRGSCHIVDAIIFSAHGTEEGAWFGEECVNQNKCVEILQTLDKYLSPQASIIFESCSVGLFVAPELDRLSKTQFPSVFIQAPVEPSSAYIKCDHEGRLYLHGKRSRIFFNQPPELVKYAKSGEQYQQHRTRKRELMEHLAETGNSGAKLWLIGQAGIKSKNPLPINFKLQKWLLEIERSDGADSAVAISLHAQLMKIGAFPGSSLDYERLLLSSKLNELDGERLLFTKRAQGLFELYRDGWGEVPASESRALEWLTKWLDLPLCFDPSTPDAHLQNYRWIQTIADRGNIGAQRLLSRDLSTKFKPESEHRQQRAAVVKDDAIARRYLEAERGRGCIIAPIYLFLWYNQPLTITDPIQFDHLPVCLDETEIDSIPSDRQMEIVSALETLLKDPKFKEPKDPIQLALGTISTCTSDTNVKSRIDGILQQVPLPPF